MNNIDTPEFINTWLDILKINVRNPFGCTLLVLKNLKRFDIIMGWFLTMHDLRTEDDNPLFDDIKIVVPNTDDNNATINRLVLEMENQSKTLQWDPNVYANNAAIFSSSSISKSTLDSKDFIEKIRALPSGIAVALISGELYRFNDLLPEKIDVIPTWTGKSFGIGPTEAIDVNHLIELVVQVSSLVLEKNIFLTIFADLDAQAVNEKLKALDLIESVAITVFSDIDPDVEIFSKLPEYVERSKVEGPEKILNELIGKVKEPLNKTILSAYIFSVNKRTLLAWETLKPSIDAIKHAGDGTLQLLSSQIALSAGEINESISLLDFALKNGIDRLENLNSAYSIAIEGNRQDLALSILNRLKLLYPQNKIVLNRLFTNAVVQRKFELATGYAEKLNDLLWVKICRALSIPIIDLSEPLEFASTINKTDVVLLAAAKETLYRGDFETSRKFASSINDSSSYFGDAIQIRIQVIEKSFQFGLELSDEQINEIQVIMAYVAANPSEIKTRIALEDLFEDDVEEPSAIAILTLILVKELKYFNSTILKLDIDSLSKEQERIYPPIEEYDAIIKEFIGRYFSNLKKEIPEGGNNKFIVGYGEIPKDILIYATPSLINAMLKLAQYNSLKQIRNTEDLELLNTLLHMITLVCKYLHDPNSDLLAVQLIAGGAARSGLDQKSRDFAETSLLIAHSQPDYLYWRVGNAWACYADVFHRSGNPIAALRCLCLTFICWRESANNLELIRLAFRITTRVFRDLGFDSFALQTINFEKYLLSEKQDNSQIFSQLECIELSIRVKEEIQSRNYPMLLELLSQIDVRIKQDQQNSREIIPLLSLQANIIRQLKLLNITYPETIYNQFLTNLDKQEKFMKSQIMMVINVSPSIDELKEAMGQVSVVNNMRDLPYQLLTITFLAESAIRFACLSKNIQLYLLALAILSQPALTMDAALHRSAIESDLQTISARITNWLLSSTYSGIETGSLSDIERMTNEFIRETEYSITKMQSIDISSIQKIISDDETLITLACDPNDSICRTIIKHGSYSGPDLLDQTIWSSSAYQIWKKTYPRAYGNWDPPSDVYLRENPSVDEVKETVESLSFGNVGNDNQIIISPDSSLAGFTFGLSKVNNEHCGSNTKIATIPSPGWLVDARSHTWSGNKNAIAWLGSPRTDDLTLHYLRDRLTPEFNQYNVDIVEDDTPVNLSGSCLAFISSHGSTGIEDRFRTISDKIKTYSSIEFARLFSGCGCLVLFTCNAGRNDTMLNSSEVVGLTTKLLRIGIKCVIASPWPLHVYVVETWLPKFLKGIFSESTVGEAAFSASQSVKERFINPCAWASLNVYGDPKFKPLSYIGK